MRSRRSIWLAVAVAGVTVLALIAVGGVPGVPLLARGLLAGVFMLAGAAKLGDRASFEHTLADLGAGEALSRVLAAGLPLVELATGVALLVPAAPRVGAVAAVVLLLCLTGAVGVSLARGITADCGCFGNDRPAPLGARTLVRNGFLLGLAAGLAALGSAQEAALGLDQRASSLVALGVAVVVALGLLAARNGGREPDHSSEAGLEVVHALAPAALTRRRWLRVAGAAGFAGAVGSSLRWLDPSVADATLSGPKVADTIECTGGCACCRILVTPTGPKCQIYCCSGCSGFSGGGVIQTPSGTAQGSFFGDKVQLKGRPEQIIGGALSWFDSGWQGTGLRLQSTQITSYRRVPGSQVRELVGLASANGAGKHRFVLRVVDAGNPGSGSDSVSLTVSGVASGGAGGTGGQYAADGHLAQGDLTTSLQAGVTAS